MRTRSLMVLVAAAATALLAACADGSGEPATTTEPPTIEPPATETPLPTSPPALSPPKPPVSPRPVPPTLPTGEIEISGEVSAGVEPGCTLLETDTGTFLLFGAAAEQVRVGTSATVRGRVRADMPTTCQQGTPFEVSEVLD